MNEWKIYIAQLKALMYAKSTTHSQWLKLKQSQWARENGLAGSKYSKTILLWCFVASSGGGLAQLVATLVWSTKLLYTGLG